MDDGYLGEIRFFAGNFAPEKWMYCMGQLLLVSENQALYSLLGTYYGGDGKTNFALPDFRGRTAITPDNRVGLNIGNKGGHESVVLTQQTMPAHNHAVYVSRNAGSQALPLGNIFAQFTGQVTVGRDTFPTKSVSYDANINPGDLVDMNQEVVDAVGAGTPHNNMQPYIGMNYIICVEGLFPSRN